MAVTVGVICAIPQELAYLRGVLVDAKRQQVAQILFDSGQLDAHRVVLAAAGMGKVNTGLTATLLADRFGCRTIVFTGVAGGLDPELCIGDIVIADRVVQHDFGLLTDERLRPYQPGHIPFIEPTERLGYPVDPAVIDRVKHRLDGFTLAPLSTAAGGGGRQPRIYYGTILTGDQYLHCERTRNRLHHELGGMAVEMEAVRWRKSARPSISHGWSFARSPISPEPIRGWTSIGLSARWRPVRPAFCCACCRC